MHLFCRPMLSVIYDLFMTTPRASVELTVQEPSHSTPDFGLTMFCSQHCPPTTPHRSRAPPALPQAPNHDAGTHAAS